MEGSNEENNFSGLIRQVAKVLSEGLKHGHFDFSIQGEIGKGHVRHVILTAGKRYKFHISEVEAGRL